MPIAFTICSANYLPFAKALADSLVLHNPDYKFIITLADTYNEYDVSFFEPHQVVPVKRMNIPHFEEMSRRYTIFELSCALKPFVAHYFLNKYSDCETVFYFDSDILVFGSLTKSETILKKHSLVITPHVATPSAYADGIFTELNVLRTGLYNAGFFGLNRSAESLNFLNWWQERLRYHCINDAGSGLFVDQLWLNLAPLYFRSTFILHDPGYNLAYWNFSERKLSGQEENLMVNDSYALVFFHYSGYDVHQPEAVSKYQKTLLLENLPEYIPLFEKYRIMVAANNTEDFFSLPVTLGKPIPVEMQPPHREKNFFKRKFKKMFKRFR